MKNKGTLLSRDLLAMRLGTDIGRRQARESTVRTWPGLDGQALEILEQRQIKPGSAMARRVEGHARRAFSALRPPSF